MKKIIVLGFRLYLHVKLEKQHICVLTESAVPFSRQCKELRARAGKERPRACAAVSFRSILFSFATSRIHKITFKL